VIQEGIAQALEPLIKFIERARAFTVAPGILAGLG
jgi:hypothetical protein